MQHGAVAGVVVVLVGVLGDGAGPHLRGGKETMEVETEKKSSCVPERQSEIAVVQP